MRAYAFILAGVFVMSPAVAAALPGVGGACPFGLFTERGAIVQNAVNDSGIAFPNSDWYDHSTDGGPYLGRGKDVGYLYYQETWTTARDLGAVMIATPGYRRYGSDGASGEIWVQLEQGGEWTKFESFDVASCSLGFFGVAQQDVKSVYGVEVRVFDTKGTSHFQVGSIAFFEQSIENFVNVAAGKPCFDTNGPLASNLMTDGLYDSTKDPTLFCTVGGLAEEFVGVDFGGVVHLQGLLIETCAAQGQYDWRNFDVQYYLDGEWITFGRANVSGGDLYWVDFGDEGVLAEKIRLYGSVAGGNAPPRDKFISEIMAFAVIPEPATMTLLALGGMALLRRRR
ncbi:MAG: PEP-CTERM sorting domain-containing protein [Phycisphaerae bacterium]|nr:PEP-CTERM sorting domain-containing protein [Phycisphaerae bacterium]